MKWILPLVVLCAALLWWKSPTLRRKVEDGVRDVTAWSSEDRRNDPVGYLEYAKAELTDDLDQFEGALRELESARAEAQLRLDESSRLLESTAELEYEYQAAWELAEEGGGYPLRLRGRDYGRDEFLEQVRLTMLEIETHERLVDGLGEAIETSTKRGTELRAHHQEVRASLWVIDALKATVKVDGLIGETTRKLAEIDALIHENDGYETPRLDPVRTVEELLGPRPETTPFQGEPDVLGYLESLKPTEATEKEDGE